MEFTICGKKEEAENIKTFFFEKPKGFNFKAGQFIYLTLPKLKFKDNRGNTRHFTISSSPTEEKIAITTKIRKESGYKMTLDSLKPGDSIECKGPLGDFYLSKDNNKPQIFIAGGIGITPFRSMIKYKVDKRFKTPIHLIYSCSTTEEITFKNELENWSKEKLIKLDITITRPEESKQKWNGLTGRLNKETIISLVGKDQTSKAAFWLCGPPSFVSALEEELAKASINKLRTEKFSGY